MGVPDLLSVWPNATESISIGKLMLDFDIQLIRRGYVAPGWGKDRADWHYFRGVADFQPGKVASDV